MKPLNPKNQKADADFQAVGDILDDLTGSLLDDSPPESSEALPPEQPTDKPTDKPAASGADLVKAANAIQGSPAWKERSYMARELVQCTLPLRNPGKATVWARKNGHFTLIIQSGIDELTLEPRGLPYGEWARLLLLWITTEAKKTGSPRIKLGRSFTNFVRSVGGDPDKGGGDAKRLKDQMLRLLDCHIDFRYNSGDAEKGGREKMPLEIAPKNRLWWNVNSPNQEDWLESELVLGDEFFSSIMSHPVRVDLRVVAALKKELNQASFAIDVYIWASARIQRMRAKDLKEVVIPLSSLEQQFGAEFKRTLDFKRQWIKKLKEVQAFFPALDYRFEKDNFFLIDAGESAVPPAKKAARKKLDQLQAHQQVSHRTRSRFVRAFPNHDVEDALSAFYEWLPKANTDPANINAFFWTFAQTWVKNNPAN